MVGAIFASAVTIIGAMLTFAWYLSARLTRQDGWMHTVNLRMGRIEKYLGLGIWDDSDDPLSR